MADRAHDVVADCRHDHGLDRLEGPEPRLERLRVSARRLGGSRGRPRQHAKQREKARR